MKRLLLPGVAIFIVWMLIDTLAHRVLLQLLYASSPGVWRPLNEMNPVLIVMVTIILILVFVTTYRFFVRPKSLANALALGALLGIALGTSAGFGTYIHSPISFALAFSWFALGIIKGLVAGGILGLSVIEEHGG